MPLVYCSEVTGTAEIIGVNCANSIDSWLWCCREHPQSREKQSTSHGHIPCSELGKINPKFCWLAVHTAAPSKENLCFPFWTQLCYQSVWGRQELGAGWASNPCKPPENCEWGCSPRLLSLAENHYISSDHVVLESQLVPFKLRVGWAASRAPAAPVWDQPCYEENPKVTLDPLSVSLCQHLTLQLCLSFGCLCAWSCCVE